MTNFFDIGILHTHPVQKSARRPTGRLLKRALLASAVATLVLHPCAVIADESSAAGAATSTANPDKGTGSTSTAADSADSSAKPIQAGVQVIELNLQTLRDLGLDIKNILKAAGSLYDEVTIQPVTIMTQPEVVGRGTIINIPIGFTPTGAGPQPTKKRLDMAMNQMRPIIQILKQDVDEFESGRRRLDISDRERQDMQPIFDQWVQLVTDVSNNLGTLENLTKSKPFDNGAIANSAQTIHKDSKEMDELRRKLYKILQKEGKRKKNA